MLEVEAMLMVILPKVLADVAGSFPRREWNPIRHRLTDVVSEHVLNVACVEPPGLPIGDSRRMREQTAKWAREFPK